MTNVQSCSIPDARFNRVIRMMGTAGYVCAKWRRGAVVTTMYVDSKLGYLLLKCDKVAGPLHGYYMSRYDAVGDVCLERYLQGTKLLDYLLLSGSNKRGTVARPA